MTLSERIIAYQQEEMKQKIINNIKINNTSYYNKSMYNGRDTSLNRLCYNNNYSNNYSNNRDYNELLQNGNQDNNSKISGYDNANNYLYDRDYNSCSIGLGPY